MPVLVAALVGDLLHFGALLARRRLANDGIVELLFGRHALPELGKVAFIAVEIGHKALRAGHALLRADIAHLRVVGKLLDADVAELHVVTMAAEGDEAARAVKTGVLLAVRRVAVALPLRDIALRDQIAVEVDLDLAADDLDFLEVPHSRLPDIAAAAGEVLFLAPDLLVDVVAAGRHDAVDRARVLVGLQLVGLLLGVVVGAAAVVEKLQLAHAEVRRVDVRIGSADAEAVVAVLWHQELEAENEVAVLLLSDRVTFAVDHPVTFGERREPLINERRIRRLGRFKTNTSGNRCKGDGRQQGIPHFHVTIIPKNKALWAHYARDFPVHSFACHR